MRGSVKVKLRGDVTTARYDASIGIDGSSAGKRIPKGALKSGKDPIGPVSGGMGPIVWSG